MKQRLVCALALGVAVGAHADPVPATQSSAPSTAATTTAATTRVIVVGSLDVAMVRRVVERHAAEVRACYERERAKAPGLAGELTMKWVIGAGGDVSIAKVESTQMHNAPLEGCIATAIKSWRFPKPKACAARSARAESDASFTWPGAANAWGGDIMVDPALPKRGECLEGAAGPIVAVSYPFVFK